MKQAETTEVKFRYESNDDQIFIGRATITTTPGTYYRDEFGIEDGDDVQVDITDWWLEEDEEDEIGVWHTKHSRKPPINDRRIWDGMEREALGNLDDWQCVTLPDEPNTTTDNENESEYRADSQVAHQKAENFS